MTKIFSSSLLCASLLGGTPVFGATVVVGVDHPGPAINPAMWGVFFEDINFGADGGLYAELIKNRSFEFPQALMGWSIPADKAEATHATVKDAPGGSAADKHFLSLESKGSAAVIENEGFRGSGRWRATATISRSKFAIGRAPACASNSSDPPGH